MATTPKAPVKKPSSEKEKKPRFNLIDSQAFNDMNCDLEWLIEGVLVKAEPGVIGGPKKTLKTSLMIEMAISLGTGKPFLGKFNVPKKVPVAVFSGESSKASLQNTARRIAASKGIELDGRCRIHWEFDLPRLLDSKDRNALRQAIRESGSKVVFVDPLYLCLNGAGQSVSVSNLYDVGPALRLFAKVCIGAGATPILLHHATKSAGRSSETPKPLDLEGLAFSGIGEFVRQWVLLNRRVEYGVGSGKHCLLMSIGGSAGHSDCWAVDIDEGHLERDFTGRKWAVTVREARLDGPAESIGSANGKSKPRSTLTGYSRSTGLPLT